MQDETPVTPDNSDANWSFHAEGTAPDTGGNANDPAETENNAQSAVSWTASEYVAHQKDKSWYFLAGLAGLAFAGAIYLFTQDWFSVSIIIITTGIFIAAAARPPRVLEYSLDSSGLTIAGKLYPYSKFKAFSLIDEGAIRSIVLQPLERFMPTISLYFDPKDEQSIVDVLSANLPYEERQLAQVDKLMRKIRF